MYYIIALLLLQLVMLGWSIQQQRKLQRTVKNLHVVAIKLLNAQVEEVLADMYDEGSPHGTVRKPGHYVHRLLR